MSAARTDRFGRRIDYLRISVTDRCNLRCTYCVPPDGVPLCPRGEILRYEEIERVAAAAAGEGIGRIRITGGEPLVRVGLAGHIRRLREATRLERLALTTNGVLLPRHAAELKAAGLARVNVSIDSLDPDTYAHVTRGGELARALAGVDAALAAGLDPVKVNVVVVRSLGQDLSAFARLTLARPVHVRFIEYMPVGAACAEAGELPATARVAWSADELVCAAEVLERLRAGGLGELAPVPTRSAPEGWGPARYFALPGALGTIGVISPISGHACASCNRLRLTADGRLKPCLFSDAEVDVKRLLRSGADDAALAVAVRSALSSKPASHGIRAGAPRGTTRTMSQIGG